MYQSDPDFTIEEIRTIHDIFPNGSNGNNEDSLLNMVGTILDNEIRRPIEDINENIIDGGLQSRIQTYLDAITMDLINASPESEIRWTRPTSNIDTSLVGMASLGESGASLGESGASLGESGASHGLNLASGLVMEPWDGGEGGEEPENEFWNPISIRLNDVSFVKYVETNRMSKAIRQKYNEDPICTICQDDINTRQMCSILNCKHIYHKVCIKTWLTESCDIPTCPCCREDVRWTIAI